MSTRSEAYMNLLLFIHKEKMVRNVIISGSLSFSNFEIMKFKILKGMRKRTSEV